MVLRFVRLQIIRERRNQLQFVVLDRTQIENNLSGLLDRHLQVGFGLTEHGLTGLRIFPNEFMTVIQFEIDSCQVLNQAVVNFAGDSGALFRDSRPRLLHVEPIEGLVLVQGLFDLGRGPDACLDQLPHEFGAGSTDDRDSHPMEVLQRLSNLVVSAHINDQVQMLHRQKLSVVARDRDPKPTGERQTGGPGIDLCDAYDLNQGIFRENLYQRRPTVSGADDRHVRGGRGTPFLGVPAFHWLFPSGIKTQP